MKPKILILSIISVLLLSCSASKHPGITRVPHPGYDEPSYTVWLRYWEDQFDGHKGNVLTPNSKYSDVARQTYQIAYTNYQEKVARARLGNTLIWSGFSIGTAIYTIVKLSII